MRKLDIPMHLVSTGAHSASQLHSSLSFSPYEYLKSLTVSLKNGLLGSGSLDDHERQRTKSLQRSAFTSARILWYATNAIPTDAAIYCQESSVLAVSERPSYTLIAIGDGGSDYSACARCMLTYKYIRYA